jgi:hypothetical protein
MSEHRYEDDLEDRDDVVDDADTDDGERKDGEPWAKTSSGNADELTTD